jgi:hypothetical protein
MVVTEDVKEEIELHLTAAKSALNRGDKKLLITQLTLALEKAENEM